MVAWLGLHVMNEYRQSRLVHACIGLVDGPRARAVLNIVPFGKELMDKYERPLQPGDPDEPEALLGLVEGIGFCWWMEVRTASVWVWW